MNDSSSTRSISDESRFEVDSSQPSATEQVASEIQTRSLNSFGRLPAATVVLSLAAGVLCDRYGSWSSTVLLGGFVTVCLFWALLQSLQLVRGAAVTVVIISALTGATYHHHVWHRFPANDISPLLTSEPVLIRCEGVVASDPVVSPPRENPFSADLPPESSTRFHLDVDQVNVSRGRRIVSGRLQIVVDGIVDNVNTGDHIDVQGWSHANSPSKNPGSFDIAEFNRSKSVRGIVRVTRPELIRVCVASTSTFQKLRRALRQRAETTLESAIPDDVRPIADAMLLGDRSLLPREMRTVFVESGTVHLLAISGLHIGILMLFLLTIGRAMCLSSRQTILLAIAVLFIYLLVADSRPPMIRAFVIIAIWSAGRLCRRPAFSANSLSIAAIVILAMNPTSLFDVGTQLSFLAVAVIFWLTSLRSHSNAEPDVAAKQASDNPASNHQPVTPEILQRPLVRLLRKGARTIGTLWLVSGSIWLISAPLVISVFNVVSPAGLAINVVLIPVVGVGLCFGFAAILIGTISQIIAWPFAYAFGWFLKGLVAVVEFTASIELGHAYVPEPPNWWLVVFYLIVATAMLATTMKRRPARVWCGAGAWIIFGLTLLPANREENSLRCTFLSVGHGLSVIVETPSGKTLVYDVGSRGGGEFPARVLTETLWARGISKVDALIVSHSDVDHYNGVVHVLNSVPVGTILCSRHFPDSQQPLTMQMFDRAESLSLATDIIAQGDRIILDDAVSVEVLQPGAATSYKSDNASSIVLEIVYQNRRILLTGDLDEDGLAELLDQPARHVDVLLAPHHGAPGANPTALAAWANPEWVIASAPTPAYEKKLKENYGAATNVVVTSEAGAVTATVTGQGGLSVEHFLGDGE